MTFYKKLVGEKCYLSPFDTSEDTIGKLTKFVNEIDAAMPLGNFPCIIGKEQEKEFLSKIDDDTKKKFAIVDLKTNELIGSESLFDIDHKNGTAGFGILIGKEYCGQGYGEEATNLILDFGFNILNLENIMLEVYDFNIRAIKCYEKCGFQKMGERRKSSYLCGKRHNMIYMDILKEDFKKSYVNKYFENNF